MDGWMDDWMDEQTDRKPGEWMVQYCLSPLDTMQVWQASFHNESYELCVIILTFIHNQDNEPLICRD